MDSARLSSRGRLFHEIGRVVRKLTECFSQGIPGMKGSKGQPGFVGEPVRKYTINKDINL
jgi:hypothetical protein